MELWIKGAPPNRCGVGSTLVQHYFMHFISDRGLRSRSQSLDLYGSVAVPGYCFVLDKGVVWLLCFVPDSALT